MCVCFREEKFFLKASVSVLLEDMLSMMLCALLRVRSGSPLLLAGHLCENLMEIFELLSVHLGHHLSQLGHFRLFK